MRTTQARSVGLRAGALALIGCVGLAATTLAAEPSLTIDPPDSSAPLIDHDLGHGVHMLQNFGGNVGVYAGEMGVLLVDAEYPQMTDKVVAAVKRLSPAGIRYVVNTHWHWDHTGGNANFARAGAVVISSDETYKHIADELAARAAKAKSGSTSGQSGGNPAGKTEIVVGKGALLHLVTAPFTPDSAWLPQLTIANGATMRLQLNGHPVEITHVSPAHTDGDLIVRFPDADVIQTGDTFFHGVYPYIDVADGGSIDGMIALYDKLYAMCGPNTKIIPGHGPVSNRDDVRAYQAMLRDLRGRVAKAISSGMTLQALIDSHPLDDLDKKWGSDVIKQPFILSLIYQDLTTH